MNKKINIDVARFVVSFLVIAIHISPFININQEFNFFFTRILGRIAVPLFFMITGYFVIDGCLKDKNKLKKYTIKILKIYLFCIILYLPINIYMGKFNNISIFSIIKDILINGTLYHLWYFPALILGIWITYYFIKKLGNRKTFITVIVLYIIGLLGDSYYGLTRNVCVLSYIYDFIFKISDYTRNGLFYAPIFLYLGYFIKIKRVNNKKSFLYSVLFFIGMTIEATILHKFNLQKHDSMYILLIPTMYVLFDYLINISNTQNLKLRNVSTIIYIFHPLFIVGIRFISGICKVEKYIVDNNFIFYLVVAVVTTIFAFLIEKIKEVIKMNKENIIKLVGNQIQDIIALETIRSYTIEHLDKSDKDYQKYVSDLYVYIVWKNKTLQNWKYLLSTNLPDSMYYELTYNGDKKEWYLDAYRKVENQCISEETMIAELKRRGLM